jgi:hypothetical protein
LSLIKIPGVSRQHLPTHIHKDESAAVKVTAVETISTAQRSKM